MLNDETNKKVLDYLGIDLVRGLEEISEEEPIYPRAVIHVWQLNEIDEGLKRHEKPGDIALKVGVCLKTVLRRRNRIFHFKPRKRTPKK
jgi:hypothetical protein